MFHLVLCNFSKLLKKLSTLKMDIYVVIIFLGLAVSSPVFFKQLTKCRKVYLIVYLISTHNRSSNGLLTHTI